MSEAIYLSWDDRSVDLAGGRVILWADRTKAKKRRNAEMPPVVVAALANLPHREGAVFRRPDGEPYAHKSATGGQMKTAFYATLRRARLSPEFTPHTLRHTWASWHYSLHKDPLRLKTDGGWSSLALVVRYAHLLPAGQEAGVRQFFGIGDELVTAVERSKQSPSS